MAMSPGNRPSRSASRSPIRNSPPMAARISPPTMSHFPSSRIGSMLFSNQPDAHVILTREKTKHLAQFNSRLCVRIQAPECRDVDAGPRLSKQESLKFGGVAELDTESVRVLHVEALRSLFVRLGSDAARL